MWDFFLGVYQSSKNNPEYSVGIYSIKGEAQYFFITENILYLDELPSSGVLV